MKYYRQGQIHSVLQLAGKPSVFRQLSGLLVPRKLETAQNRKVWAARAKPVLPTNDIF